MNSLEKAPNIGPVLAAELRSAGIDSLDELQKLGSFKAWDRIRKVNVDRDCASSLLALEGAVRGVRWMSIDPSERKRFARYASEARRAAHS